MKIALLSPFNPYSITEYLSDESSKAVEKINTSATSINALVLSLLLLDVELVIYTLDNNSYEDKILFGNKLKVYIIGVKSRFILPTYFPILPIISNRIVNYLRKDIENIDIIHSHWTYEYAIAGLKFSDKRPVVCTVRDWAPTIYENLSISPFYLYFFKKLFWLQKKYYQRKVILDNSITLVSNSLFTKLKICTLNSTSIIHLIYNSISQSDILIQRKTYPTNCIFVSVAVNVDDKNKNIDNLIKAFNIFNSKYPDSRLIIVGKIHFNRKLYMHWSNLNLLRNVEFHGFLDRDSIFKLLDNSSCMVHPSYEETFGNVLLEAMARRLPIIAGKHSGAVPFVLKNGQCGCLCDIKNPLEISKSMFKIIEDIEYTNSIVNAATEVLLNDYSSEIVADKHIELYQKLLSKK